MQAVLVTVWRCAEGVVDRLALHKKQPSLSTTPSVQRQPVTDTACIARKADLDWKL